MAMNLRHSDGRGGFPAVDSVMNGDGGWGDGVCNHDNDEEFDEEDNPFESIGRALDLCEEDGAERVAGARHPERMPEINDSGLLLPMGSSPKLAHKPCSD